MSNHVVKSITIGGYEIKMQSVKGFPPNFAIMLHYTGLSDAEVKRLSINKLKRILDEYLNFHTINGTS